MIDVQVHASMLVAEMLNVQCCFMQQCAFVLMVWWAIHLFLVIFQCFILTVSLRLIRKKKIVRFIRCLSVRKGERKSTFFFSKKKNQKISVNPEEKVEEKEEEKIEKKNISEIHKQMNEIIVEKKNHHNNLYEKKGI